MSWVPAGQKRLMLVLAVGIVAISSSAILIRLSQAPSLTIAFWRVTFSSLLLAPVWLSSSRRCELFALTPRQRWQLLASGVCLGLHFWSWISSLAYTSVTASVLLVTTNPLWVALLAPWAVRERPTLRIWLGIAVAMSGTAWVALGASGGQQTNPLLGNGLALLGAFAASGYLLLGRSIRPHLQLVSYASATLAVAWITLALAMLLRRSPFVGFPCHEWLLFFAMAALPQMLGHNAFNWALRYLRADVVSVILLAEPIGAALLAWLILHEIPSAHVLGGGPLLLAGVALVATKQPTETKK